MLDEEAEKARQAVAGAAPRAELCAAVVLADIAENLADGLSRLEWRAPR